MVTRLFERGKVDLVVEKLPDEDWVTLSQHVVQPIRAGRFHVRTPDFEASAEPGVSTDFVIPASQAFGTGQHATTAGLPCDADRNEGARRDCAQCRRYRHRHRAARLCRARPVAARLGATASDIDTRSASAWSSTMRRSTKFPSAPVRVP